MNAPPVVAVSGWSGSGKTRLLSRLIPALARRGVSTAVVKHTLHAHPFDRPGKDTEVLRRAGAVAAAIEGPAGLAFFGPPVGSLAALAALLPQVELVLAEGWKDAPVPRVEVHRRGVGGGFLCARDPRVFAVVTDEPPPRTLPTFAPDDVEGIARLLCERLRLPSRARRRARLRVGPAVSRLRSEGSGRTVAPGRRKGMAKTMKRGSRRGGSRSRQGAGRKGGRATLRARGPEFFSEIGRKGGKRSGRRRRAAARRRAAGTRSRGGMRSRRNGRARRP